MQLATKNSRDKGLITTLEMW